MKTKIVYCLVSNEKDYYYEQFLISLCSLRKHNPDAVIEIICDYDTFQTLKNNRAGIYKYNVTVLPVDTPNEWGKWERSRYIKTNLRRLTKGDYLFIDTDTIICSSLDTVDDYTCDIGAVYDSHVSRPLPKHKDCKHYTEFWIWSEADKAGIDIGGRYHFNSGVFYVKDTPIAYELYKRWDERYRAILPLGPRVDQLPLLLVNKEMGNVITPIPSEMNCHVNFKENRRMFPNVNIIHYFFGQRCFILSSPWIMNSVKETGDIPETIRQIIDKPFDFFNQYSRIIKDDRVEIFNSPVCEAYRRSSKLFRLFEITAINYHHLKDIVRKIL